jgi:hypothetical protein
MHLIPQLLQAHTKENCNLIVAWVGNNQKRFDELFACFLSDDKRLVQVSSWPLSFCVEAHPILIKKHFAAFIKNLDKPAQHEAVKRHSLRILQFVVIPKKYEGIVMNICFNFIQNIAEKPTTKVFSLVVLENLVKQYPEIKEELHLIIETQMPYESAGFKSRGKRILAKKMQ